MGSAQVPPTVYPRRPHTAAPASRIAGARSAPRASSYITPGVRGPPWSSTRVTVPDVPSTASPATDRASTAATTSASTPATA